jgi:ketosteroid isomerase-like protein
MAALRQLFEGHLLKDVMRFATLRFVGATVAAALFADGAAAQTVPVLTRTIPAADSTTAKAILGRTRAWHDAIQRGDTAALRRLLLPEFSLTTPPDLERGHVPLERYLGNTVRYQLREERWESSDVRILGDVAVVTSRYWQSAASGGRDRSGYFVLTDVWRRDQGEWRAAARWSTWLDMPGGISPAGRK